MNKASYEAHIEECKKYKNGKEYDEADKPKNLYKNYEQLKMRYPDKNIRGDAGWSTNKR